MAVGVLATTRWDRRQECVVQVIAGICDHAVNRKR